jgi:MazG family protein
MAGHRRPDTARAAAGFARLVETMAVLRSPRGCPWDRQQTHRSLRAFLLEETYEVLDAIDRDDLDHLAGELGDVLFQCVFHAQLAVERRHFEIGDVVEAVTAKLIRRHPHVFSPEGRPLSAAERRRQAGTPEAVLEQWTRVKTRERTDAGQPARVLSGIPRATPALTRAHTIGARVATVGFDWPGPDGVLDKIEEEVRELRAAVHESPARMLDEMGDVLFSLANLSRKLGIHAEEALARANDKFIGRFERLEVDLEQAGQDVHSVTPPELEAAWTRVKGAEATRARSTSPRTNARRAASHPPTSAPAGRARRSRR